MFKRIVSLIVVISFLCTGMIPPAWAQEVFLPLSGSVVSLSPSVQPCVLKGLKVDAKDPLRMEFLFDEGESRSESDLFEQESLRLIKYFLASLTIPNKDLWVNLSPYESERIVQEDLGRTGMGRDLLAQDYILKQLTAGLLHPDGATGKAFWAEIYRRSFETFGTTDIPVDTFNKVWIVPGKSVVYESRSPDGQKMSAFVDKVELNVMLESDHIAMSSQKEMMQAQVIADNEAIRLAKDVLRQVVIPVLEKEVNEGSNFSLLRQICHSLILSSWLKKKLFAGAQRAAASEMQDKNVFMQVFVDQHKTEGVEIADARDVTRQIYERYVEAFKKGAYDLIKEEVDVYSQELIPRKYFSGGFTAEDVDSAMTIIDGEVDAARGNFKEVEARLSPQTKDAAQKRRGPSKMRYWTLIGVFGLMSLALMVKMFNTYPLLPGGRTFQEIVQRDVLDSAAMLEIVYTVTEGKQQYDSGVIRQKAAGITPEQFLGGVLAQPVPQGMTLQQREQWLMEKSGELSAIIRDNVDVFGKDLVEAGLTGKDVALLLSSIMIRESSGDMLESQILKGGVVQARGALQFEFRTWWDQLQIAQDQLQEFPGEFQEFYHRIQEEKNKPKGSLRKNVWKSNSETDMVVSPTQHLRMAIMWLNHMVHNRPVPVRVILNDADKQLKQRFNVTVPEAVQQDLDTQAPTLAEFMRDISKDPDYKDGHYRQMLMFLLAVEWNGGVNRDAEELRAVLSYVRLSESDRFEYQERAAGEVRQARKKMMTALGQVHRILKQKRINAKGVLAQDANRASELIKIYGKIPLSGRASFLTAWWRFRSAELDYLKAQAKVRVWKSALYSEIVLSMASATETDPLTLGGKFTKYRDHGKEIQSSLDREWRKERAAVFSGRDHAQASDASGEPYGGIDLTAENVDVQGEAGMFAFDLTPERLSMLKEDLNGFLPLIIHVKAVSDVKIFLGAASSR